MTNVRNRENPTASEDRNYNFDLLKVIAMLMIVLVHSFSHGGLRDGLVPGTLNYYVGNLIYAPGLVSTNCFVLVSGYFLCTSTFKLKKLLSIWAQVVFYSLVVYLVCCVFDSSLLSVKELIKSTLAVSCRRYWFATDYVLLYMFFPFLNCTIQGMDRRKHMTCCCVLILIFTVMHNVVFFSDFSGVNNGYSFLWMCVVYILAAYMRLYVPVRVKHQKWMLPAFFGLIILTAASCFVADGLLSGSLRSLFYSRNSILLLPASLCLFQYFRGVTVTGKKTVAIVKAVLPMVFGVYLIHDHATLRPLLWEYLGIKQYYDSPLMLPVVLLCVLGIFLLCIVLDWIRQKAFKWIHLDRFIDNTGDHIQQKGKMLLEWMDNESNISF